MEPDHCPARENWARARAHLREKFSELTDEDLVLIAGREENLLEAIVRKTGRTRETVLDAFSAAGMFTASRPLQLQP